MPLQLNPQQVRELSLNESHCLTLAEEIDESLSVTLIDANHCPGAVMFLFEGYFGRILYTGDFRYSHSLNCEASFTRVCSSTVDKLFLDNTFCSPRCNFPSREKAMGEMLSIISEHADHRIMIGLRKLGKESLLVAIAKYFRTRIFVTEERFHRFELLQLPDVFTTVESETRINVVDQCEIHPRNMNLWNEVMPTLAIIPTALYCVLNINSGLNRGDIFVVPYSDHSTFIELCEFVATVRPREVIPILTNVKDRLGKIIPERGDMSCFADHLDKTPALHFCPPVDVTVIRKDFVRSRPRVTVGSVPVTKIKRFKFKKSVVCPKGVVYEHTFGDEQSQNSAPRAVDDRTVGNADAETNEEELGNSKDLRKVEENGLMDKAAADVTNGKCRRACAAGIRKQDNANRTSEHTDAIRNSAVTNTAGGFNFLRTDSELALPSVPLDECKDVRKCRERDSKQWVKVEAAENTYSSNSCKARSDLTLPLVLLGQCEYDLTCKECCSQKLAEKEVKDNSDRFNSCQAGSEQSVSSVTLNEIEGLKCTDDSSKCFLGKEIIKIGDFCATGYERSTPLNEREDVLKHKQGSLQLVSNNSVANSLAGPWLPSSGGYHSNNCRNKDVFLTQCSESEEKVMLRVSHETLKLSALTLQSLDPIFAEEAQSIFEHFLKAQNKH